MLQVYFFQERIIIVKRLKMFKKSKARKNGPLKALQSVLGGGGDSNNNDDTNNNYNMPHSKHSSHKSNKAHSGSHQQQQQQKSKGSSSGSKNRKFKDDMSMAQSQNKEKVKANPYATIKMWRPVSMATNSTTDGEVYQTFTNFDAFRHDPSPAPDYKDNHLVNGSRAGGLPPTGDLRNQQQEDFVFPNSRGVNVVNSHSPFPVSAGGSRSPRSHPVTSPPSGVVKPASLSFSSPGHVNGFVELPADYPADSPGSDPSVPGERRVSFQEDSNNGGGRSNTSPAYSLPSHTPHSSSSIPVPPPLPTSPPPSLPNGLGGNRSRPSTDLSATAPAAIALPSSSSSSSPQDSSFQVVSDGTTTSVKLVLSHTYSDVELAGRDVERLLAELKLTMDSLRTRSSASSATGSRSSPASAHSITKSPGQLGLCLSEFHAQTKAFVQAAKEVVSAANDSREERLLSRLQAAVHALARLFLHGQASMLMLPSASDAQRLGMQLIRSTNAFKATLGAAHAAMGKSLNDPHMKYLMRQATNLAALLGALLGNIKEVQTA